MTGLPTCTCLCSSGWNPLGHSHGCPMRDHLEKYRPPRRPENGERNAMTHDELIDEELIDALLYENEPPKPRLPWENLNNEERAHYRKFAQNLLAHLHEVGLTITRGSNGG